MRCPGYKAPKDITVENVTVDIYASPRELGEAGEISKHVAILVQTFGQDFVLPHLRRFAARCRTENIDSPQPPCMFIFANFSLY